MRFAFYILVALAGLALLLISSYWRWQKLVERERFFLAMKEASTPESMRPEERSRLELLRSPGWAVWRWLPDLFHRPNTWPS